MRVNFATLIEHLREIRTSKQIDNRHYTAEYIYHLISVLMESEKLINGEFYSPGYIEEHCITLYNYARQARQEETFHANR